MAIGKKTGGNNFKAGQPSANPAGRPPTPPDLKESRALTRHEFERVANLYLNKTVQELEDLKNEGALTAIECIVVTVIIEASRSGDEKRLDFLLDRLIGKVPTKELKVDLSYLGQQEFLSELKEAIAYLEGQAK